VKTLLLQGTNRFLCKDNKLIVSLLPKLELPVYRAVFCKCIDKQILEYRYRWPIEYRKLAKYRWKKLKINIGIGFNKMLSAGLYAQLSCFSFVRITVSF